MATQRDKWHTATERGVKKWEAEKNAKEQAEYEQKKARIGVKCPHCLAKNEKGLKSHFGQKHNMWKTRVVIMMQMMIDHRAAAVAAQRANIPVDIVGKIV